MATYKVIQDIEAEDHILGPLTLRQFIYGLIAIFFFYLSFVAIAKNGAFLLVILLPPGLFSLFFAIPFGRDQPTEVWALAKIRFFLKPRKRIWNQDGRKDLVTITVPKRAEVQLTNQLSQDEVKDRLEALAATIDSRGWVIKNSTPVYSYNDSDRLIDLGSIPQPVPDYDTSIDKDMLDNNNPLSVKVATLINQSTVEHRKKILSSMEELRHQQPVAIAPSQAPVSVQPSSPAQQASPQPVTMPQPVVQPVLNEEAIVEQLKLNNDNSSMATSHMHNLRTSHVAANPTEAVKSSPKPAAEPVAKQPKAPEKPKDPAILNLATNDGISIASIQREAQKVRPNEEVVINLH